VNCKVLSAETYKTVTEETGGLRMQRWEKPRRGEAVGLQDAQALVLAGSKTSFEKPQQAGS